MRRSNQDKEMEPQQPGAFMPDGSFKQDGGWVHQGPTHTLIASLVRQRRAGRITPPGAAALIRSAGNVGPFPNLPQWETCSDWLMTQASTSAEAVVKYAGGRPGGES